MVNGLPVDDHKNNDENYRKSDMHPVQYPMLDYFLEVISFVNN